MIPNEFLSMEWTKTRQREILRDVTGEDVVRPRFDTPKSTQRKDEKKNDR